MADYDFDLFVIGAGSGGVRASRVAAAHGARVAVAEEYRVGGTCVIRGCVPKKLLVYGAHFAEDLADARRFGWKVPTCDFDWTTLRDNVLAEVKRIEGAYGTTLASNNVETILGRAIVTGPNSVRVGETDYTAAKILIATGATPDVPAIPGAELGITSNEVFDLPSLPKRILIAGAGYIANEFAGIFQQFGAHVTLVNRTDVILRQYERQIVERLLAISMAKGIEFKFNTTMEKIERLESGALKVVFAGGAEPVETDMVLFATGRRPNTKGLGLEAAGIQLDDHGAIPVDADSKTVADSVYAVGDVTNRVQLTPVAIREGHAFADSVFGNKPWRVDYGCIPSAVFSHPPLAGVGLTEEQARLSLGSCKTYTADFRAMKNVLAGRNERALYKMVVHPETDVVLGIHMIGPDSPEILQAAAVAVKAKLTKQQFDETVALHPSMAEELVLMR
ncbi:glutathione-disulfide reductase [Sphingomonas sp. AP4-R1]|uniref:glutathione-disulfide reductase n=1 Tax=Sphingomonas sp. AP4-R1 TaxID=2735134 RepID=UPI0014933BC5|nr:glutathione-disulfide reductase [Sphingomonas sp. AP4-R1]QJU58076.1 glutathione-disulfide reductase [Sphingomonas sp. AP4-R1]